MERLIIHDYNAILNISCIATDYKFYRINAINVHDEACKTVIVLFSWEIGVQNLVVIARLISLPICLELKICYVQLVKDLFLPLSFNYFLFFMFNYLLNFYYNVKYSKLMVIFFKKVYLKFKIIDFIIICIKGNFFKVILIFNDCFY